jgi:putative transcriptional regulator
MTRAGGRILKSIDRVRADLRAGGPGGGLHTPDEIAARALRLREGLSQAAFAEAYGLDLRTLQDWEQGRSAPTGAARTLLKVIRDNPAAVRKAAAAD